MSVKVQLQIAGLTQQVVQLQQQGRYEQAIKIANRAHKLARRRLGKDHPFFAQSLANLASLYHAMGDHAAAEPLLQQALETLRSILGENHPGVVPTLYALGGLYRDMGNYAAAEPLFRQALEITRTTLGERHLGFGQSLNSLAMLYLAMGKYAEAEPLLRQALEITRATLGEGHIGFAQGLSILATLYHALGNYAEAEPLFRRALQIYRTALGEEHPDVARTLSNLGEQYRMMGNYTEAEPLLRQASHILRTALGEGHPDVASSLTSLGELYRMRGNYAEAEPLLRQALEIRRTALGEGHPVCGTSLTNLAMLYHAMGDYTAAEPLYRQALEITRKALGEEHPDLVPSLNNLAELHRAMGDYAAAELLYQQALDIGRAALGEEHPDIAGNLNNLAGLYRDMGNHAAAEPLYRQALEITRKVLGKDHPDVATILNGLASLCAAMAREAEAMALMKETAAIQDRMIGQIFSVGSESQRMAYLQTLYRYLHDFLSLIVQHPSLSPDAVQAGLDLVLRRKAIGAEALAAQRDAVLGGRYPTLEHKLREWTTMRIQIGEKTLAGPGPEGLEAHQQLLAEWTARKEGLEAELARQIPEMNLEQKLRAADRQAVAMALPRGTALVEFVHCAVHNFAAVPARGEPLWEPARYLAFVLPAGKPDSVHLIDLGEAGPVDGMIAAFRASLTSGDRHLVPAEPPPTRRVGDGSALRATVFDPLAAALDGCTRLFIAPDGDLTRLPFEALPAEGDRRLIDDGRRLIDDGRRLIDDGRHLIDDYRISYLGVGRDVLRFGAASTGKPARPLVVADPDFDLGRSRATGPKEAGGPRGRQSRDFGRSALRFERLPGTRVEGERVGSMLGVRPWLGDAALEARLKAHRSPRILHIATHGFFLPAQKHDPGGGWRPAEAAGWQAGSEMGRLSGQRLENPLLRSGLALAGANTWLQGGSLPAEAEDAILNGEDVSGLDLLATELVVLSACETGLGQVLVGEGVFGLRRAFLLAGAKTLVMSLWKVPDRQTQELMEAFYRRLLEGQPRADALREAQLAMKARYPNPLYWGAFICQGDPGPLP
jgi:CHAT domain-containing protein/tetratricopeptide (TPR) repeat protein